MKVYINFVSHYSYFVRFLQETDGNDYKYYKKKLAECQVAKKHRLTQERIKAAGKQKLKFGVFDPLPNWLNLYLITSKHQPQIKCTSSVRTRYFAWK